MTPFYHKMVAELKDYLKGKIKALPSFQMHENEVKIGVDALTVCAPKRYGEIIDEAHKFFLERRQYELSYNQMCQAFFDAADELGKINLINYGD